MLKDIISDAKLYKDLIEEMCFKSETAIELDVFRIDFKSVQLTSGNKVRPWAAKKYGL